MQSIYEEYVDADAPPARTTVEVSGMNNDYLIEVDAIAPAGARPTA
jgi:enamine deaminase RidA (YjgF/YER057c/UK114 family)